jgi:uncharacterized caspase-like protein
MHRFLTILLPFLILLAAISSLPAGAAPSEKRLALVIGNASYKAKTLATVVNDAALIAQTLRMAGFDVMGARDLDRDLLRQTFRDFVDSVAQAGPDAVAVVYFAGYGLQFEGENYLVPVDAEMAEASDVSLRALRLSEQTKALAALPLKTAFLIVDAAHASPFVWFGQPPASGLAWIEPETNMLIAFNAAPGTVSPDKANGYGPYAMALAEMIREGSLTPAKAFDRVRLRVNELTKGAQVPWDTSKADPQFMFLERGPGAPPRADSPERTAWMRSQPMRSLGASDGYMVALMRDTFDAYTDFLADYWRDPMTKRVRALLGVRRESITWQRTCQANVAGAYWSYLERYPRGPHVADARRLLARLGAATAAPAKFAVMEYEVPPPLPDELQYIERTALVFDDPVFAFEPPPPLPAYFLGPPPPELLALEPPAAPSGPYALPAPMLASLPAYVVLPASVTAPPITSPGGIGNAGNRADSPRLPPAVAAKAMLIGSRNPPPQPAADPTAREQIKALPVPPPPTASLTPLVPASPGVESPALTTNREPVAMTPPSGVAQRARRDATLPPPATGSVPLPNPRPAIGASPPIRKPPKPAAQAASTSSPTSADQAQQPAAAPSPRRPAPSTPVAGDPNGAPAVSPPKPPRKQCRIVNGELVCS